MKRIEEFQIHGKNIMYIDLSNFNSNEDFVRETALIEPEIAKYPEKSLYTITSIENVRFDSNSKEVVANYMKHNKPYIKKAVVIGFDGIKKVMINMIVKMSGRTDVHFAFSKQQAIEWLLEQD
jgi:hypothetical protein